MTLEVRTLSSVDAVEGAQWDVCVAQDDPFSTHGFLQTLERSQSVGGTTGCNPAYIAAYREGTLVGVVTLFEKFHSYGEYTFDWNWAEASERAGLPYYPKLASMVPYTPATGRRFMLSVELDASERERVWGVLSAEVSRHVAKYSGGHFFYLEEDEADALGHEGYIVRHTHQYHWFNRGYASFDDFLAALRSSARKQIRRERRKVAASDLTLDVVPGARLTGDDWEHVYRLYQDTGSRKWGKPYLTRRFFESAGAIPGTVVATARRAGRLVAMALAFEKGDALYGRYWGAFEDVDGLHFELCYYRLIEYAIEQGHQRFEAGAQGEHKLKRGFEPVLIRSAHRLTHPGLHAAVVQFCEAEAEEMKRLLPQLAELNPFRKG